MWELWKFDFLGSGVTLSRAPGGKMLLSAPPLQFNVECFYSIVNHQIQRVRSAVNISSIWCFLPHKSLDPVAYRGFLAPGAYMGIGAPPFSVSDWQAQRRSPFALSLAIGGGLGRSPSHQRFWDLVAIGSEWSPFLNSSNTIFNFSCQTGKRRRRSAALLCYLGVNGTHFWIALTLFSTRRVRLARAESSFAIGGSWAEPQSPTLLGAFKCDWNPFLNSLNIIFNSFGTHCGLAACDHHSNSVFRLFAKGRRRQWYWCLPPGTHRRRRACAPKCWVIQRTCFNFQETIEIFSFSTEFSAQTGTLSWTGFKCVAEIIQCRDAILNLNYIHTYIRAFSAKGRQNGRLRLLRLVCVLLLSRGARMYKVPMTLYILAPYAKARIS